MIEYFLLFFIYCIIGYIFELVIMLTEKKGLTFHRGFLFGPYLPVYGSGCLAITLLLGNISNIFLIFIASFILTGVIEYLTGYLIEKIFGLRWWDYSKDKFNIKGIVRLKTLVIFGIGGIIIVKYASPALLSLINIIPNSISPILVITIGTILIIDIILSMYLTFVIKNKINVNQIKDYTSEIKNEIYKYIKNMLKKKSTN